MAGPRIEVAADQLIFFEHSPIIDDLGRAFKKRRYIITYQYQDIINIKTITTEHITKIYYRADSQRNPNILQSGNI